MEECHKLLTNQVDDRLLRYNVSRPLLLGGPPGQVTIQIEFFFNRDLDYLQFGIKGDRLALSIIKMKAAYYLDVGLEQMFPDQIWIEEECMYDISATYGISHWWFKRQKFYIDRHSAETNQRAIVRTHMRILSVVRIEVFFIYGYDYMKKIVLPRVDNQEYTIAENDFKDLYSSDFDDLYLLNLQGHLNHLPPRDKKILSTVVNLWIKNLEATGLEFMHDYKILDSPRAVLFRDKYGMQMLMRFNEIHKFSDETLQQIDEALDYRTQAGSPPSMCQTISNIDAHVEGEQFHESKQSRVSSLESDLSKLKQTNHFAEALSSISGIVDKYLTTKVKDTVDVVVKLKSDKIREEAQAKNQDFLNLLDSNMKRIIKEHVKAQTSKILTKVEKYVTETLGAEVLVRSTNQPQTSYAVASSLSELELKKILMDKIEENNSIDRSHVHKNLYRALLKAYNSDKDLLSSYDEVVTLKRRRDDQEKDEEPSTRLNRGSKRQRLGKEESSKEATQKKSKSTSSSKGTTRSSPKSLGKSIQEEEHDLRADDLEEPFHQEFDIGNDDVSPIREATNVDERLWNQSGSQTPD
ncbi:hypothetical protein Tco_0835743 [Tanacetum coccineum]